MGEYWQAYDLSNHQARRKSLFKRFIRTDRIRGGAPRVQEFCIDKGIIQIEYGLGTWGECICRARIGKTGTFDGSLNSLGCWRWSFMGRIRSQCFAWMVGTQMSTIITCGREMKIAKLTPHKVLLVSTWGQFWTISGGLLHTTYYCRYVTYCYRLLRYPECLLNTSIWYLRRRLWLGVSRLILLIVMNVCRTVKIPAEQTCGSRLDPFSADKIYSRLSRTSKSDSFNIFRRLFGIHIVVVWPESLGIASKEFGCCQRARFPKMPSRILTALGRPLRIYGDT